MGNQTGSKGYAYDAANKLTLEGDLSNPNANGNIQYTYDSNGNTTKKAVVGDGNTFYYYDAENRMTKLSDGATLTFTYTGDGARFSWSDGTATTKSVYDRKTGTPGLDTVLLETDNSGTTTATYTHGLGLISQKRSSTTSYYHFEAIGTTRQLTNSTETVTDTYVFDGWGNQLNGAQSTTNPYRYVGRENYYTDGQSGLMLLGVRYYESGVGRFWKQDPIREGRNWYIYGANNPINAVDPTGLWCICIPFTNWCFGSTCPPPPPPPLPPPGAVVIRFCNRPIQGGSSGIKPPNPQFLCRVLDICHCYVLIDGKPAQLGTGISTGDEPGTKCWNIAATPAQVGCLKSVSSLMGGVHPPGTPRWPFFNCCHYAAMLLNSCGLSVPSGPPSPPPDPWAGPTPEFDDSDGDGIPDAWDPTWNPEGGMELYFGNR